MLNKGIHIGFFSDLSIGFHLFLPLRSRIGQFGIVTMLAAGRRRKKFLFINRRKRLLSPPKRPDCPKDASSLLFKEYRALNPATKRVVCRWTLTYIFSEVNNAWSRTSIASYAPMMCFVLSTDATLSTQYLSLVKSKIYLYCSVGRLDKFLNNCIETWNDMLDYM